MYLQRHAARNEAKKRVFELLSGYANCVKADTDTLALLFFVVAPFLWHSNIVNAMVPQMLYC